MPLLTLCLIASCTLTSRLPAPIIAADGVLEAPSPFLSIRFPGHSENSFRFRFLLYFFLIPLRLLPRRVVQMFTAGANPETSSLLLLF
jgi:hypothetical protein